MVLPPSLSVMGYTTKEAPTTLAMQHTLVCFLCPDISSGLTGLPFLAPSPFGPQCGDLYSKSILIPLLVKLFSGKDPSIGLGQAQSFFSSKSFPSCIEPDKVILHFGNFQAKKGLNMSKDKKQSGQKWSLWKSFSQIAIPLKGKQSQVTPLSLCHCSYGWIQAVCG